MVLSFLYCVDCTKFGQLIFRKIIKIVDSRCHILWLKCTKFDFGLNSAPDSAGGAYSAPPNPLAGLWGPTSKGRRGRRDGEWVGRDGRRGKGTAGMRGRGAKTSWRSTLNFLPPPLQPSTTFSASEMTYIVSSGALNSTHSLTCT